MGAPTAGPYGIRYKGGAVTRNVSGPRAGQENTGHRSSAHHSDGPYSLGAPRDRALLLFGFASAMRRSESSPPLTSSSTARICVASRSRPAHFIADGAIVYRQACAPAIRHLLHSASRMIAAGEDPFAIHVLIQSADKLLIDVAERSGKNLIFKWDEFIKPECSGPGPLNRFSASVSGVSAGVRLPCGWAAG